MQVKGFERERHHRERKAWAQAESPLGLPKWRGGLCTRNNFAKLLYVFRLTSTVFHYEFKCLIFVMGGIKY